MSLLVVCSGGGSSSTVSQPSSNTSVWNRSNRPADFEAAWLPEMKKEVYAAVFADFFGVEMRASA